jgi:hypothetical protein
MSIKAHRRQPSELSALLEMPLYFLNSFLNNKPEINKVVNRANQKSWYLRAG